MKNPIVQPYAWLLATVFIIACNKDQTTTNVTPPPPGDTTIVTGTMNVNLTYPNQTITGSLELIISEPGGKVLLDTMVQAQTPIVASLKTNATLVDITYILDYSSLPANPVQYDVFAYKGINPTDWVTLPTGLLPLGYPWAGSAPPSQLLCRNYPAAAITDGNILNSFVFMNGVNNIYTHSVYDPVGSTLTLSYNRRPGLYNYFVLPHLGLYKFYIPVGNSDTLDLNSMDTANRVTFNRNFPFTLDYQRCSFQGIADTTDLTKSVSFMSIFNPVAPSGSDLQYPKTPMQKYEIGIAAMNSLNDNLYYYRYGATVPTNLNFPDASSFSVISQQADNFSIKFNNPSSTSYCLTRMSGSKVYINMFSSADSTTIHMISFLSNLKSKLLNGATINDLVPKTFEFGTIPGFPYKDYLRYISDPALLQTHQINGYTTFSRSF